MLFCKYFLYFFTTFVPILNAYQVMLNSSMAKQLKGQRSAATKQVSMVASINYSGYIPFGPACSISMEMALERMIANEKWLPDYNFTIELIDDKCQSTVFLREYGKKVLNEPNQTLGRIPFTTTGYCLNVELPFMKTIWHFYDFIAVTLSTMQTSNKMQGAKYPNTVYELRENTDFASYKSLVELLNVMNWQTVAIFSTDSEYYSNLEALLIDPAFGKNLTISYIGPKLLDLNEGNVDEVQKAMETLVELETRVLIAHTGNGIDISCWLHRYGMYGPNYVILSSTWNMLNPEEAVIPDYLHWCTKEMLEEVAGSWIYFGMAYMKDVFGATYTDSLGLTFENITKTLDNQILGSQLSQGRTHWWPQCYDPTVLALHVVGEVETILNEKYNSTLSEWTTDSQNYHEHGEVIVNVFKEAMFKVDVRGTAGLYNFDEVSQKNTKGLKPIMFYQSRYDEHGKFLEAVPASYFNDNDGKFYQLQDGFLFNGSTKIPAGSVKRVSYEVEILQHHIFIVFAVFASFGIFLVICNIFIVFGKRRILSESQLHIDKRYEAFRRQGLGISMGLIVLLASLFVVPTGTQGTLVTTFYSCHAFLISTGFAIILASLIWKLQQVKSFIESRNFNRNSWRTIFIPILWVLFQVSLISTLIGTGLFTQIDRVQIDSSYSLDKTVVYKAYLYQYGTRFLSATDTTSIALIIAISSSTVVVLAYCVFQSYRICKLLKIQSAMFYNENVDVHHAKEDIMMTLNTFIVISTLLCGTGLIAFILKSNAPALILVSSVSTIVLSFSIVILEFIAKFSAKSP